ncbi:TetR/AcrR family transcriptional regulator [Microbacterium paludicola]|uniref:TetR/AcrR family transcriptional regulator n=1 Tax=Microbacterium paludicola TaxID=300019 RepID=UPI0031D6FDE7
METPSAVSAWRGVVVRGSAARRRATRPDRDFDALLSAGRDAFAEHGPGASLEDIARRAGVGIGTLYRNFPTRDALIGAVYVAEVEKLVAAADDVAGLEPWSAIEQWVQHFIGFIGTKKALITSLNRESDALISCRGAMYSAGAPLLVRAQDAGIVRDDVSIEDVIRLISGVAGVAYADEAQRARVTGLALDGLRTR